MAISSVGGGGAGPVAGGVPAALAAVLCGALFPLAARAFPRSVALANASLAPADFPRLLYVQVSAVPPSPAHTSGPCLVGGTLLPHSAHTFGMCRIGCMSAVGSNAMRNRMMAFHHIPP